MIAIIGVFVLAGAIPDAALEFVLEESVEACSADLEKALSDRAISEAAQICGDASSVSMDDAAYQCYWDSERDDYIARLTAKVTCK